MNKTCIVGYNFGTKYLSFIPIYIYSILKHYPNYDVIIFSDSKLDKNTNSMLKKIEGLGNFRIVEDYDFGIAKDVNISSALPSKQSIRWLFFDTILNDYDYVYIGDIDIFICKETMELHEQHIKHCELLGLPYSNYIRTSVDTEKLTLKSSIYYIITRQYGLLRKKIRKEPLVQYRLTGLHFVKRDEYYSKVVPLFKKYINLVSSKNKIVYNNDESVLYDLVQESGLGLPPISPNSPDIDSNHYNNIEFRPHHGIHLGIFRNKNTTIKQRQLLQSYVYKEYFSQIYRIYQEEEILKELLNMSSGFVNSVFDRMFKYYLNEE